MRLRFASYIEPLGNFQFNYLSTAEIRGSWSFFGCVSVALPYVGKFLKGATPVDQKILPESGEQIFVMSQNISDALKEDLAWATYVLLRNTNSLSVLISIQGELCIRGYWNTPNSASKTQVLEWFERQIEEIGLSDLQDSLYSPQSADKR